jgi:hypothetical protein
MCQDVWPEASRGFERTTSVAVAGHGKRLTMLTRVSTLAVIVIAKRRKSRKHETLTAAVLISTATVLPEVGRMANWQCTGSRCRLWSSPLVYHFLAYNDSWPIGTARQAY